MYINKPINSPNNDMSLSFLLIDVGRNNIVAYDPEEDSEVYI